MTPRRNARQPKATARNNQRHMMFRYAVITILMLLFSGAIAYKLFSTTVIHAGDWNAKAMKENAREFINTLIKLKPATAKGTYIKSIYLSSTMSPGVKVDTKSIEE